MNEFSFYHIVNKHSEDAKKRRKDISESPNVVLVPMESSPCSFVPKSVTQSVKRKSGRCVFRNVCCIIATLMIAVVAFGMMALFTLVV